MGNWPSKVVFDEVAIKALDVSDIAAPCKNRPGKEYRQFAAKEGYNYRTLAYLAQQYESSMFLDLGTRRGASALALAAEPSNLVISWDRQAHHRKQAQYAYPVIPDRPNVNFRVEDAMECLALVEKAAVIYIDLSHNGTYERRLYSKILRTNFDGLLLFDDIDYSKFYRLASFWKSIKLPKDKLEWAHFSGLGVVSCGQEYELR
jgi:hypothetical protein